jgi:hypothetical protein
VALEQSANATLFGTQTVHATIAIRNFRSISSPPSEIDLSLTAAYPMLTRGKHCGANRNGAAYRSDIASKMVADAVRCEPVSAAISLLAGKNTGNFAVFERSAAEEMRKTPAAQ